MSSVEIIVCIMELALCNRDGPSAKDFVNRHLLLYEMLMLFFHGPTNELSNHCLRSNSVSSNVNV